MNSGFMTLTQAIGVVMGANIGTTITGWILVIKIGKYGLPLFGISALVFLFSKKEKLRYLAMAIMGIGMIFFGLELMKDSFKPLREVPEFRSWFAYFSATTYFGVLKCAMVGCVLTFIVQSSSATLGITMGLASAGVIPFETAAALVVGENMGTTITAFLASLGTSTNAKRAAYSHIIFNLLGVVWITSVFSTYLVLIRWLIGTDPNHMVMIESKESYPYILQGIALVHSVFNVANTLVFLPFLPSLANLVTYIVPDKPYREKPHLEYLDLRMVDAPALGITLSYDHVATMGQVVQTMLHDLRSSFAKEEIPIKEKEAKGEEIVRREEVLDIMQREAVVFLTKMLSGRVPKEVTSEAHKQLRTADEYESISDHALKILMMKRKLDSNEISLSEESTNEILTLHAHCADYIDMVQRAFTNHDHQILSEAKAKSTEINELVKSYKKTHLERISLEEISPLKTTIFPDILSAYRSIKSHALNIAETLSETETN